MSSKAPLSNWPAPQSIVKARLQSLDVTTVKKLLVDIPEFVASAAGKFLNETIEPLLTQDQVIQMKEDCVLKNDKSLKTLHDLGIEPSSLDKYAFDFLHRFRPGGHFAQVEGYH